MCLLSSLAPAPTVADGPPRYSSRIVETRSGAIRGVILELDSRHLEPVEAFKAVPYAAPPVDALRFEAPQTLRPWEGTRLADTFGDVCPQVSRTERVPIAYRCDTFNMPCRLYPRAHTEPSGHREPDGRAARHAEGSLPVSTQAAAAAGQPERGLFDAEHLRARQR